MTHNEFVTGGFNSPYEWDLSKCDTSVIAAFWDTFLDGMVERNAEYVSYVPLPELCNGDVFTQYTRGYTHKYF